MIYGFAKQAGGVATLESAPDAGTKVRLYLPRYEGAMEQATAHQPPAEPVRGMMRQAVVVVVEDDANVRDMVHECLAERGLQVLTAADGQAGLELALSTRDIDLLVTDVGLPGMNGRQLADAARAAYPGLKVLLMTGYAGNAARGRDVLDPGIELIVKPFSLDVLGERVQRMLEAEGKPGPAP
ncbi:Blue-light-activated protein [compost metagenome]